MDMKKIVFLDADTVGDDVDLSCLSNFGDVTIYGRTSSEHVVERAKEAEILITNKIFLNKEVLEDLKNLRLICIAATGTNNVDLEAASQLGITVKNTVNYSTESVAQHTFMLVLNLIAHINYYDSYVKSGEYASSPIFTHIGPPFFELKSKNWGIIGLGNIGRRVADIALQFGANISYYSTSGKNKNPQYNRVSLDDLLSNSDVISIHAPLNAKTKNLIGEDELQKMKKTAYLINVGRGEIVNEQALAESLNKGIIAGAGIDVLSDEPPAKDNPLLHLKHPERLLITPHIAWAGIEAREELIRQVCENIKTFLNQV
jgi:glycerate dehydrogenase